MKQSILLQCQMMRFRSVRPEALTFQPLLQIQPVILQPPAAMFLMRLLSLMLQLSSRITSGVSHSQLTNAPASAPRPACITHDAQTGVQ